MNRFIFSLTFLLPLFFNCQKDNDKIKNNYVEFEVNKEPVLIYSDPKLNKAGESFSYTLSKEVETGKTDTMYTIQAVLKGKAVSISFPRVDHPQKYSIFRKAPTNNTPHGTFQNVVSVVGEKGLEVFYSSPWPFEMNENYIDVVGEINITYANISKNEFAGTFKFNAFGYYHTNSSIDQSNNTVEITNGSFHGIWPTH